MKLTLEQVVAKLSHDLDVRPKPGCVLCKGTGINTNGPGPEGMLCGNCYSQHQIEYARKLQKPESPETLTVSAPYSEMAILNFIQYYRLSYIGGRVVELLCSSRSKSIPEEAADIEKAIWYLQQKLNILKHAHKT